MNRAHVRQRPKNPLGIVGGGGFSPSILFGAGEQGFWYDPSDLSTLFQDQAGTVPVTAAGQVVGLMMDKSGNANHASQATAASKPILRNTGLLWWLEFDGVDDYLSVAGIDFTATDELSLFTGIRKISDAAIGVVCELSVDLFANNGTFLLRAPTSVAANVGFVGKGTSASTAIISGIAAPISLVFSGDINISGDALRARVNGGAYTTSASDMGTGTFGSYPMFIGRRAGTSLPFSGNMYGLICRNQLTSSVVVASTEAYLAAKSGVTL